MKRLLEKVQELEQTSPQLMAHQFQIREVESLAKWLNSIEDGDVALDAKRAAGEPGDCVFFEARCGDQLAGYVAFLPDRGGAHWHRAFVDKKYRRAGLARDFYARTLQYLAAKHPAIPDIVVTADPTTDDGRMLIAALGFTLTKSGLYHHQSHHPLA